MGDPLKRFFDLSLAAATSRRLLVPRQQRTSELPPVAAPAPSPPVEAPLPPVSVWTEFQRPPVDYKVELWDALIEWVRQSLAADGCFVLDERGFLVASCGDMGAVPPEVFLSAFTTTDEMIAPYTGTEGALQATTYELSLGIKVTMLPVQLVGTQTLLLGVIGGMMPSGSQVEEIHTTIAGELLAFESGDAVS
jgi:hypothetical protein